MLQAGRISQDSKIWRLFLKIIFHAGLFLQLGLVPENIQVAPIVVVRRLLFLLLWSLASYQVVSGDVRRDEEHLNEEKAGQGHRSEVEHTRSDLLREELAHLIQVNDLVAEILTRTFAPLEELVHVGLHRRPCHAVIDHFEVLL